MPTNLVTYADAATPIFIVPQSGAQTWKAAQTAPIQAWLEANAFTGALGEVLKIPNTDGSLHSVVFGWGKDSDHRRGRFAFGKLPTLLKSGAYRIESDLSAQALAECSLAWLLAGYTFETYKKKTSSDAILVAPTGVDHRHITAWAEGEALTRDLINTPASDMGPQHLEDQSRKLAKAYSAKINVITGAELLQKNFPMIHAVGRAATQAPRLIDMTWGTRGPHITLVGKGVCFDTGGLNLKPGSSMGLMKKDMGGSATVLGLAKMIMQLNLSVQLRVLIPAVENSVSGNAFRPQDVLISRKGLSVEVNNTDAEGRLVLADALTYADEVPTDLIVCMATLTGAARVAVGPDLAPYYTDDLTFSHALEKGALSGFDPVWRLPLHRPYEDMIEPDIADLDNAPSGGFAGSITAALFLNRFVENTKSFTHFDIYGWNPSNLPARPKGGAGQGARALLNAITETFQL